MQVGSANPTVDQVAFDSQERIVVSGSAALRYENGKYPGSLEEVAEPLVARFAGNGHPDPSFGSGGAITFPDLAAQQLESTSLSVDASDRILFGLCEWAAYVGPEPKLGVMRVQPDGSPDASFGSSGMRLTAGCPAGLTSDGNRVLVLTTVGERHVLYGLVDRQRLEMWNENGSPYTRFGTRGAVLSPPQGGLVPAWQDLALDNRGRISLIGEMSRSTKFGLVPRAVVATRLSGLGKPDPSFGSNGQIVTRLHDPHPSPAEAPAEQKGRAFMGQAALALSPTGRMFGAVGTIRRRRIGPTSVSVLRYRAGRVRHK
jgi:uncharacterized delta-60 repeat protein